MTINRKIIIIYAGYGDGHLQVSKALQQNFHEQGITNVLLIDLFALAHSFMNAVSRFAYLKSSTYFPRIYGWSYDLTSHIRSDEAAAKWKWMNSLCIRKLKEIIELEAPDAVINTFPMLAMSELRRKTGLFIPTFTVITDFVLHGRWLHPETDKYFVATDHLKALMKEQGVRESQIKVSGIPVRQAFREPIDKHVILQEYDLDPAKKMVLIVAGAYGGMSNLEKMVSSFLMMDDVHILLVCGKNASLRKRMEASFGNERRLHIYGFIEHMQELMTISTCIITKAGGITLAEALALQLPIVVFRPSPGQEKGNARFLVESGAIYTAANLEELKQKVSQLLTDKQQMSRMRRAIRSLRKPNAAKVVVTEVLDMIDEHQGSMDIQRIQAHK